MASSNSDSKTSLFVGGLDQEITEAMLHAAFIPFGNIVSVELARDPITPEQHKGYGFVEFELEEDCEAALDNMNQAELNGKVIKVKKARPQRIVLGSNRAVWADDAWLREHAMPENEPAAEAKTPPGPPPQTAQ